MGIRDKSGRVLLKYWKGTNRETLTKTQNGSKWEFPGILLQESKKRSDYPDTIWKRNRAPQSPFLALVTLSSKACWCRDSRWRTSDTEEAASRAPEPWRGEPISRAQDMVHSVTSQGCRKSSHRVSLGSRPVLLQVLLRTKRLHCERVSSLTSEAYNQKREASSSRTLERTYILLLRGVFAYL